MDVRVEELGPTRKKIHVVVPQEAVKKEIEDVYVALRKTAKVKGFRPGKIPREILKRYYNDYVTEQVISRLIESTYKGAISESKILPVSLPNLENEGLTEGKPFRYSAVVEVEPEIKVDDYVGIPVTKGEIRVEEKEVAERLARLQQLHAQLRRIEEERPVREGDFVLIDFRGTMDGKPFKGGQGQGVSVEIGAGGFAGEIENGLIGARCDEEREIEAVFPEDHRDRALAGKKASFRVKVREIREKVIPPLDDEFAKDLGSESLEELREKVRGKIEEEKRLEVEREMNEQILDHLKEKNRFEV
ncbi:MAG: trigger factor, partial [Deltaproteobacteria bacterium]|nr:trigger factor [Deltaproteobacteria bacterium]